MLWKTRMPLTLCRLAFFLVVCAGILLPSPARPAQIDIVGPSGSGAFGSSVAVLPNGNVVATDPNWSNGSLSNVGAVYLYNSTGTLIASFTGSSQGDYVGGQITLLTNGNFVIGSPAWNNGTAANVGAVTWVDGNTGMSGEVSAANSLVGTTAGDLLGAGYGVFALRNGNYVVVSRHWSNGAAMNAGAVTWANGSTGLSGAVSASNSLVGTTAGDQIGSLGDTIGLNRSIALLSNGNFVIASPFWTNGSAAKAGAVTLVNGNTGMSGPVTTANSLVGATANDQVGLNGTTALKNGNYVVKSSLWNNVPATQAGAVTWADGNTGLTGVVSIANSLVGTMTNDYVGSDDSVTPLDNGNYVVGSTNWHNGAIAYAGAVTWANGNTGLSGPVSVANSLVGTTTNDQVGHVVALSNGNYVVASAFWSSGRIASVGAATWANGMTGLVGPIMSTNSLIGSTANDKVGAEIVALKNGNYAVNSYSWSNRAIAGVGAVTWANGTTGLSGPVSVANSLVGTTANEGIGSSGVTALANGNYVVASDGWSNGGIPAAGAVTWANGTTGLTGTVSAANSLVGTSAYEFVGNSGATALENGNYVVPSSGWNSSASLNAGAVTWINGSSAYSDVVSAANSLVGTTYHDDVGDGGVTSLSNGNYVVVSNTWINGGVLTAGAISLGRGSGGSIGPLLATNSVLGTVANGGYYLVFAYDATRDQLVVGQPMANVVSLLKADLLFVNSFE